MARPSRPPGFDMTYRPQEALFGAPLSARLPSMVYLAVALLIGALVLAAEASSSNSALYVKVIEENSNRPISIATFAWLLVVSALASVLRSGMRGVRVLGDGIEYRDIVSLIVPRRRKYRWPQMDRIVLDQKSQVAIDLWDGTRAFLPRVRDHERLAATLEQVAAARAIPVKGGHGLYELPDVAELGPEDEPSPPGAS